jgi:ABC-type uncharacterized transport system permease subunit
MWYNFGRGALGGLVAEKGGIPLLGDLLRYLGAIPTVFVSIGFAFIGAGIFGHCSATSIVFGFALIFLGLSSHFSGQSSISRCNGPSQPPCPEHEDGKRHAHFYLESLPGFTVCVAVFAALVFALVWRLTLGSWPAWSD